MFELPLLQTAVPRETVPGVGSVLVQSASSYYFTYPLIILLLLFVNNTTRWRSTNQRPAPPHVVLLFTTRMESGRGGCWESPERVPASGSGLLSS